MGDRRAVDDLSIEELEQVLLMKRRQARAERLRRLARPPRASGDMIASLKGEDEADPGAEDAGRDASRWRSLTRWAKGRRWSGGRLARARDTFFLAVEILALVGLVVVTVVSIMNLRALNQEVALAREPLPTPSATPQVQVQLLPGGHSPPSSANSVPQRLSDLVQPIVPVPIPTPGPSSPTRIVIPSIDVDAPVVTGDDWEQLKKGAGHHIGSANPGERGNCFISAHNDIFGEIFRDLDKVELEDEIIVYAGDTPYRYVVKAKRIVEPDAVDVMASTASPVLTLMTCYPYMIDTHRLVVIAELAD